MSDKKKMMALDDEALDTVAGGAEGVTLTGFFPADFHNQTNFLVRN